MITPLQAELVNRLKDLAIRRHYHCYDSWYSCPKSDDGCANDLDGDDCNCGADEHNAEVLSIVAQLNDAIAFGGQ
jgi:hypothetical protein